MHDYYDIMVTDTMIVARFIVISVTIVTDIVVTGFCYPSHSKFH